MYETMEQLRNLPQQCMQEDFLVHEVGLGPQHTPSPNPTHFSPLPCSSLFIYFVWCWESNRISLFFFFLVVLGFEVALHMLDRQSTT
jgi:hypothetical protein